MAAVWMVGVSSFRRTWRVTLAVTLLVAVGSAVALAAVAGARRTTSAFPRILAATDTPPLAFAYGPRAATGIDPDEVEQAAGAMVVGRLTGVGVTTRSPDGRPGIFGGDSFFATASDGRIFYDVGRPRILRGRMPDPDRVDEVAINPQVAKLIGLEVGETLPVFGFDFGEAAVLGDSLVASGRQPTDEEVDAALSTIDLRPHDLVVTGVVEDPTDIALSESAETQNARLFLTPAFLDTEREQYGFVFLDPSRAADGPAAVDALQARFPGLNPVTLAQRKSDVASTATALSSALLTFGAVVALALLMVIGPVLRRQGAAGGDDEDVLVSLGMARRWSIAGGAARSLLAAVVGSGLGGVLAFTASGLFPLPPLDRAELDKGAMFDAVVHLGGAALLAISLSIVAVARRSSSAATPISPSRLVSAIGRAGAPPSVMEGFRRAVQRPAERAAHPLMVIAGVAVAVGAALASGVFGTSLDALVRIPRSYGLGWERAVQAGDGSDPELFADRIKADEDIADLTLVAPASVSVGGRPLSVLGVEPVRGDVGPVVYEGRDPTARDEIALGARTLGDLGMSIGDTVDVAGADGRKRIFSIVGKVIVPDLDASNFDVGLGRGGVVSHEALSVLGIERSAVATQALVTLAPGADPATFVEPYGFEIPSVLPAEVRNYERVRDLPRALAGVLALLGIGALTHGLLGTVRSRRKELGVLRALGFVGPQVLASVAAQAITVAVLGTAVGAIVGLVAGRFAWRMFATSLGVLPVAAMPGPIAFGVLPAVVFVALVIAVPSAWRAAAVRAAEVLRSE
jgi:hypothetical protein